jgi:hypothetical protein
MQAYRKDTELPRIMRSGESDWPTEIQYYTNWPAVAVITIGFAAGLICVLIPEKRMPAR